MLDEATSSRERTGSMLRDCAGFATAATFAAVAMIATNGLWPSSPTVAWLATLAGGVALVLLVARGSRRAVARRSDPRFLGLAVLLFATSRAAWVAWTPTIPVTDFALYDWIGSVAAAGGQMPLRWPEMGLVAAWGYGLALGGAYALLGHELAVGKGLNVALGAAALVLEYALARRIAGRAAARVASTLFLVWPGQLLYSGVLGSEHLAVPLLLGGLLCLTRALEEAPPRIASPALVAGALLLSAAFLTRSVLGTAIVAAVVALLLDGRLPVLRRVARCAVLLVVVLSCTTIYRAALNASLGVAPVSAMWWSVLVGANHEAGGRWNAPDVQRYTAHPSFAAANEDAQAEAWRRVASDPPRYAMLAVEKIGAMWQDGAHPVFWTTLAMTPGPSADRLGALTGIASAVTQAFHVLTLLLAVAGMVVVLSRGTPEGGVALALLVLLLTTAAHGVVETQSRYNYPLQPLLFVFAAIAVTRGDDAWREGLRRP
jgi:hypothetical protein